MSKNILLAFSMHLAAIVVSWFLMRPLMTYSGEEMFTAFIGLDILLSLLSVDGSDRTVNGYRKQQYTDAF